MANNQIRFNIGFNIDRTGLNELQSSLAQVQVAANRSTQLGNLTPELRAAGQAASQLEEILNRSWNSKLGQLDLSRVNNEIKKTYGSVSNLRAQLEGGGAAGAAAYNRMASSVLSTNLQLKQSNKLLDEMAISMANTVKWGVTAGIFNKITQSIQQAFNYTKKLDTSLNDIRIVTDKSAESMEKFAVQANKAAKNLGASTMDYTQASLIYYQQGLDDEETAARAETTLKAANVTGQTGAEVSEQLTAVWNGYKVTAEETELYIDKLAAVAATTAADLEELSVGMSKVASAANIMGVDIDQLNAQLATIVSVTREAPESIGTALKTVYARMSDITAGMDSEVSLDEYTKQMATMGINVLDANNNLRDMGEVVEEIGGKWTTLTREQQTSLAQTIAGTRQYSRMMSLFDNWDMYTKALETSSGAAGTLQKQQDTFMESTKAHLQQLKTEAEETYDILFDQDTVNGFADTLTGALGIFNNFLKGTGGGLNSLVTLGLGIANIFNKQIGNAINNQILNLEALRKNAEGINLKEQFIQDIKTQHQAQGQNVSSDTALLKEAEYAEQILNIRSQLTTEEYNELTALQQQIGLDEQRIQGIEQYREIARDIMDLEDEQIENFDELDSSYQERIEIENESLQILRERRGAFNEELQIYQDLNESDENRAQSAENLRDILEQLPQNQADQIEATRIISDLEAGRALNETDILNVQRLQRNQVDEQRELVNRLRMGAQGVRDAESGVYAQLVQQRNAREALLQQQIQERQQSELMSNMTRGIFTALTGITTIGGVIKTINDESMGIEEKISSISTTMLMFLPFFIANFVSLGSIIPGLALSMTRLAAVNGSVAATQALMQGTTLGLVGAFKALITSTVTFMGITAPLWAVVAGAVAIVGALGLAIWGVTKALNADAEAAEKAAEAVKAATKAYNECREAVEKLKDTMSDYKESIKQLEKLDKTAENYAETLEDVNEKARALIETYKLYDDYTIENGVIKINEEALDEISDKEEANLNKVKLYEIGTKAYNDKIKADKDIDEQVAEVSKTNAHLFTSEEIKSIATAMGSLESTVILNDEALKEALLANENLSDNTKELVHYIVQYKYQYKNLADSIKKAEEASLHYAQEILSIGVEERYKEKYQELTKGDSADYSQLMAATTAGILKLNEENENNIQVEIDNENEKIKEVKNTTGLNKVLEQYGTGYTVENKEDLMLRYAEVLTGKSRDVMTYNAKKKKVVDETGEDIVTDEVSEQVMSQEIAKFEAMNAIKKKYASKEQEGEKEFSSALEKVYTSSAEIFGVDFSGIILDSIANGAKNFNLSSIFPRLNPEEILAMEKMSPEQLASALNLTPEQIKDLGYSSAEAFEAAFDESLSKYDISAFLDRIKSNIDLIGTAMEEFDDGLSEETIKELEAEYTELGEIWDKNSKEYLEALEEIRELEEENLKKGLEYSQADYFEKSKQSLQEFQEMVENSEAGIEVDESEFTKVTEELENNLKEFFEQSYELDISITNDIITDVENIVSQAENAAKAVELIGDGFKVAAEDSEELLTMFPELAENAEVLADGTIQLSNTVTSTILKNQGIEIDADKEKVAQSIDNRITELEAKKASAEAQLEAIQNTAADELELEEILGESYADFSNYKSELSGTTAEDEVFNSGKSAEAVVDNWAAKEQAAMDYASTAIEAEAPGHKTNGPRIDSSKSNIKTEVSTQNTTDTVDDGAITEAQQRQKELAEEYVKNQIDSYETQIADLTIAKSKLFGSVQNIEDSANDKDKKDKDKEERDEEYKDKDEEIDRYWELNEVIKTIEESISDLDKKQSKLHGKELIASLRQENELLEQQAEAYKALAAEQQKEASELQAVLSTYGVIFDTQGGIANYLAASQSALEIYNQAVTAYNAFLIDEATFQAAQRAYDNFKSQLERYEALYYEEMVDTQNKLDDIRTKELENNLQAWETEIQIQLDLSQAERDWNDFLRNINKNFTMDYENIGAELESLLKNVPTYESTIFTDIDSINTVIEEIKKLEKGEESDMFGSISEAQEKLKELMKVAQDDAIKFYDLYQNAWDAFMQGIDQSAEKFDDLMGQFERIDNNLEYQKELIELLYGEEAYRLFDNLYKAQEKNSLAQIDSLKKQKDMWYEKWQSAEEGSAERAKYYDLMVEAEDKLNSKVVEHIKLLKDDYANTVDGILKNLETNLTGGKSMEEISEEWDRITEKSDKYLDNVEGLYEIQTLANKISNSIAETSSLKNQQKLQKLYDKEIDYLREKEDLTKYDLEAAEARYQIALKEIALEDAQNAKNSMKLTRGADGNWSYQYVADEEAIFDAQQSLLDASHNLYQLANDAYQENLKNLIDLEQNYLESYRKILEDENLSNEERDKKLRILADNYYKDYEILAKENALYRDDLAKSSAGLLLSIYKTDEESLSGMTSRERDLVMNLTKNNITDYQGVETAVTNNYDGIRTKADEVMSETLEEWTSGAQFIADAWNADDGESVKAQVTQAHEEISRAADEYQQKVDDVATTVGQDFSEDGIAGAIGDAKTATEELEDATDDLISNTINELDEYESALREIAGAWDLVKASITESIEEAREYAREIASIKAAPLPSVSPNTNAVGSQSGFNVSGQSSSSSSSNKGTSTSKNTGGSVYIKAYKTASGDNHIPVASKTIVASDILSSIKKTENTGPYGYYFNLKGSGTVFIDEDTRQKIKSTLGFATGGYTGDWEGKDGKLAFLHSKELVLNSKDTKNILDAVNTVRSLSNLSSSIEDMIAKNLNNMIMKMSNIGINSSYNVNKEEKNMTENIFHVTAEFPNANDVNSIKEAFLSLPNIVSQYIAENKK